jgi:hypothetical protein
MYRGWTTRNGFDRQMSARVRAPGDLYAASDLPGSRWWEQRKRDWQRRGRRAAELERHAASVAEQSRQLQLIEARIDRHRLNESRSASAEGGGPSADDRRPPSEMAR